MKKIDDLSVPQLRELASVARVIRTVKQEMAEIIFNAEFVKTEYAGNSCKNIKKQINTDELVDYYERKEACDYTVDENEADDTYQINSQDAFNYYDYRIGSTGGFNRNGNLEKERQTC